MSEQEAAERPGAFRKVWRFFFGQKKDKPIPETAAPTVPVEYPTLLERRYSTTSLVAPAEGGLFEFSVDYELIWSASVPTQAKLTSMVDEFADSAEHKLRTAIWPVGRRKSPFRPDEAERTMNEALRELAPNWCYGQGNTVSCRAQVFVRCDPRIVERWLPAWQRMAEMDAEHKVSLLRLDIVGDLLPRWRDLLDRFDGDPAAVQAARLVDEDLAKVLASLSQQRRTTAEHLVGVLGGAAHAHRHVGLFEFANAYDKALRSFERQAGLEKFALGTNLDGEEVETTA
ncbi:MAG TPA: hypothetical protein VGL47_10795 [Amycolatopsis sp.]|uniref:Uncharacterized protein n=1 Tax=Amycolatopsis nalaikhensis TaxID=715472 RepID=A0ABY8Y0A7_9PSEU|nr:hypothetical protein [Amycolatopsis sp. 2-2]WIV61030.1 hypothetical protein QP939_21730 [Amycolatopsis sp. 2-2]